MSFINSLIFSSSLLFELFTEYTIEVFLFEIGKKAKGPFFVKIWTAALFIILSCKIIVVYAVLLYFFYIFLLKYLFVIELNGSQLITSSYLFK